MRGKESDGKVLESGEEGSVKGRCVVMATRRRRKGRRRC